MATFYIQLENKLLQISGELTAENISKALGYVPVSSNVTNELSQRVDNITFDSLKDNPFLQDGSGELNIVDETGNIIAKIDAEGIHSVDFITGEHRLSNKTDKTYVDEAVKNVKVDLTGYATEEYVNNIDFYNIKDNPIVNNGDGKLLFVDENGYIGLQLEEDGLYVKDVIGDGHKLSDKADRSELSNYATKDEVSDLVDMSVVEELQGKVNTLVGEDSDKSVRTIANEELAALLLAGNDNLQSLLELAAWIDEHPEDASAMNEAIQTNTSNITKLDSAYKEADVKVLTDANEYTDNINFYTIKDNPIVNGEAGSLTFVDETGYIGLKVTEEGIIAKDVVTPEHKLSDKANTSDIPTKVSQLQNDANYITTADIPSLDEYVTETELNDKGYLTEHLNISHLAEKSEIPSLDGYATEEWVEDKNYLTEHLNISHLASKEELNSGLANINFDTISNTPFTNDESGELNIIDEQGNIGIKLSEDGIYVKDVIAGEHILSNKQDSLISGSNIKTINGESILGEGNIVVEGGEQDLSEYAKKSEIPTKVSQLENDANFVIDDIYPSGIYAVTANKELIDYNEADESCIGVALVAGEHKFMIAKSDATNDGSNYNLYWTNNTSDLSLTNYSKIDGTNSYGYLPKPDGTFGGSTHLSDDFTTWTNGALSDFNGKDNTEVIAAASSHAKDMCTVLNTFNQTEQTAGRSADWYVPAYGQLALMYLNMTEINAALAKIGGTALATDYYWSSSERSSGGAWGVDFSGGYVGSDDKDSGYFRVRFIRDISVKSLKERVSDLESSKQNTLISGTNIKTINGESILGSGDIVIEGGSSSGSSSSGAYAEVNHGTSDTTFTLTPNTFHVWDEVASLDLSFADETAGVANEYLFQFTSGARATTLTLPDVKWVNDVTPEIISDKLYLISILNNMASIMEFNNSIFPYTLYFYEDQETPAERNPNSLLLYTKLLEMINSGLNPSTLVIVVSSGPYFHGYTPFTISTITNKPGIIIADVGARMYLYILQEDGSITYYDYD